MYTRSRSGTQTYGAGRGGMNSFSNSNNFNQQGMGQQQNPRPGGMQQQQQKPNQQQNQKLMQQQPQPQRQQQMHHQQQQHQQQHQQQQAVQNQQQSGPNQPQSQQSMPQTPRLKPILKQTAATPAQNAPSTQAANQPTNASNTNTNANTNTNINTNTVIPNSPMKTANDESMETTKSDGEDQPRWKRVKVPGTKVNRKLKRLRLNQRLRKTLMPKNALMVLNEMKAGVKFSLVENHSLPNSMFLVHAELDGKVYVGQGLSKPLARQNAAENALKGLLLEKMNAASKKIIKVDDETENVSQNTSIQSMEEIPETGDNTIVTPMDVNVNPEEGDEIPWSSLASFALYKLFLEWQNQGTVVPMPRPGVNQSSKTKAETKPPSEKKLPPNPCSIHPVMLLNQMRPGSTYVEVSRRGNPPNTLFTLGVDIDGQSYCGEAKNKKDAKKMAAKAALKALFNLEYPPDNSEGQEDANSQPMQIG